MGELIDKVASEIAEEANKCCNRSDGYEEDLKEFSKTKINKLLEEYLESLSWNT